MIKITKIKILDVNILLLTLISSSAFHNEKINIAVFATYSVSMSF